MGKRCHTDSTESSYRLASTILGAKSKYASTNSISGAHGSSPNTHPDTTICCQQHSCSESRWLQFSSSIHVLCYEPSSKCLHVALGHGLQLDEQQVLPWTGSIPPFLCTTTLRAVSLRLLLDFIPGVNDLGQLITFPLLACLVNLIGIIAFQRKRLGAHVSQAWPTGDLALRRAAMPDSNVATVLPIRQREMPEREISPSKGRKRGRSSVDLSLHQNVREYLGTNARTYLADPATCVFADRSVAEPSIFLQSPCPSGTKTPTSRSEYTAKALQSPARSIPERRLPIQKDLGRKRACCASEAGSVMSFSGGPGMWSGIL